MFPVEESPFFQGPVDSVACNMFTITGLAFQPVLALAGVSQLFEWVRMLCGTGGPVVQGLKYVCDTS